MSRRKIYFFSTLALTSITIFLLITGSSLLTKALDRSGSLPLGTLITWTGMIALPLSIYWGIKAMRLPNDKLDKFLSITLKIILLLGVLWVPISYLLAGNLSFTFSDKEAFQGGQTAMKWFWGLSYGIGIGSLFVLITYWIKLLFQTQKAAAKKQKLHSG